MSDLAIVLDVDAENPIEGDLRLEGGQLVLVTGIEAIRQELVVRLRWFRGEWFLDRRTGVPWFQRIIGHRTALRIVEQIIRNVILSTPGIEAITTFTLAHDNAERRITIDFEARTSSGEVLEYVDFVIDPPTAAEEEA